MSEMVLLSDDKYLGKMAIKEEIGHVYDLIRSQPGRDSLRVLEVLDSKSLIKIKSPIGTK